MTKATLTLPPKEKHALKQLIVFRVSHEEFGVPIEFIQEIIKIGLITPIPDSPDFIKGLINVRGDIVAAIDLTARFFLPRQEIPPKHVVIVKSDDSLFGLIVDEVIEVLRINEDDIKPPPQLVTKTHEKYVSGIITYDNRLIIILDIASVLSEKELSRLADEARRQTKSLEWKLDANEDLNKNPLTISEVSQIKKQNNLTGKSS